MTDCDSAGTREWWRSLAQMYLAERNELEGDLRKAVGLLGDAQRAEFYLGTSGRETFSARQFRRRLAELRERAELDPEWFPPVLLRNFKIRKNADGEYERTIAEHMLPDALGHDKPYPRESYR